MLSDFTYEESEADFPESPFSFQMITSKSNKDTHTHTICSGMESSVVYIIPLIVNKGPQNH